MAARSAARSTGEKLGFGVTDLMFISVAVSELARNILLYARHGHVTIKEVRKGELRGVCITARDQGPGIPDIELALQDGYSTSGGLGLGLPGVRRLMDEFQIDSKVSRGTVVKVTKWLHRR